MPPVTAKSWLQVDINTDRKLGTMISIIVPTYKKKATELHHFLSCLLTQTGDYEVIISDVETPHIAALLHPFKQLHGPRLSYLSHDHHQCRTRARAMNLGVRIARGDILLFLHSDMILPSGALHQIEHCIYQQRAVGGGFLKKYDQREGCLWLTEWLLNMRVKYGRRLVGTNAIFVQTQLFPGYHEHFLEDVILSDSLIQRYGRRRIAVIELPVVVSAIKYRERGPGKAVLINALIMLLYRLFQAPPEALEAFYQLDGATSYATILRHAYRISVSARQLH